MSALRLRCQEGFASFQIALANRTFQFRGGPKKRVATWILGRVFGPLEPDPLFDHEPGGDIVVPAVSCTRGDSIRP